MENFALEFGLGTTHNCGSDLIPIPVCSVCLTDLTDKNSSCGRSHQDMCDQCSKMYDYVEHIRVSVAPYIGANARKFRDEKVMRIRRPAMRCPICGQDAFFQDAGLTTIICSSCGHRLIQFNNSTVSVWNSIAHMSVEYDKQKHVPLFDRSDGSVKNPAELECFGHTIVSQDTSITLVEQVNKILRGIKL